MDPKFYKEYFATERDHWWTKVRRKLVYDFLKKYVNKKPSETKILDFGCGSGYLVGKLAERGYISYGLDMYSMAVEYGKSLGIKNLDIINSKKTQFPNEFFNVILLMDVIEHIEYETPILQELERILKPGGIILITAPAYMFMWGIQDEVAHHFRRYTLKSITSTVKKTTDLNIVYKSYFNTFLFLPIAAIRLISRWFNIWKRDSDVEINNRFLNNVFYYIFSFEAMLLRFIRYPFGVSVLLIIKKID